MIITAYYKGLKLYNIVNSMALILDIYPFDENTGTPGQVQNAHPWISFPDTIE